MLAGLGLVGIFILIKVGALAFLVNVIRECCASRRSAQPTSFEMGVITNVVTPDPAPEPGPQPPVVAAQDPTPEPDPEPSYHSFDDSLETPSPPPELGPLLPIFDRVQVHLPRSIDDIIPFCPAIYRSVSSPAPLAEDTENYLYYETARQMVSF